MLSLLKKTVLGIEIAFFTLLFFWVLMCVMEKDWVSIFIIFVLMVVNRLISKKIRRFISEKIKHKEIEDNVKKWYYENRHNEEGY